VTALTVASAWCANRLTHAGAGPTPIISAKAWQKWLQLRARRSYAAPGHCTWRTAMTERTRAGERLVTPRGMLSR